MKAPAIIRLHRKKILDLVVILHCLVYLWSFSDAFSMPTPPPSSSSRIRTIFNVPGSGWKSSKWNWGYAIGTGHDCAAICRRQYSRMEDRKELVQRLINAPSTNADEHQRLPANFEEVKLVLALAWQKGRWDGSDGGEGGYRDILLAMADARRYEDGDDATNSLLLFKDMEERFHLLDPSPEDLKEMENSMIICETDTDAAVRCCSGLVLKSMGFIDNGI